MSDRNIGAEDDHSSLNRDRRAGDRSRSDPPDHAAHADGALEHSNLAPGALLGAQSTPLNYDRLLRSPHIKSRGNARVQAEMLQRMQQTYGNRATQRYLQRQAAIPPGNAAPPTAPSAGATPVSQESAGAFSGWIVDDSTDSLMPGQMKKSVFLSQVRGAVRAWWAEGAAHAVEPAGTEQDIDAFFSAYTHYSTHRLEEEIRRSVPGASAAGSAPAYVPLIVAYVRRIVASPAARSDDAGFLPKLGSSLARGTGTLLGGMGRLLFKPRASGPGDDANPQAVPQAVKQRLGVGQPLHGGVRSKLESAFGHNFSDVRVHDDQWASQLSDRFHARAFTVGSDIAFGAGEYRPGTLLGDALIAHELAHVAQQAGAPAAPLQARAEADSSASSLEEDADVAAVRAVVSMRGGAAAGLANISQQALPRLRSGLRLQRCGKDNTRAKENIEKFAALVGNADQNADELVSLLGSGSPSSVAEAILEKKNLNNKEHLKLIAGTAGGRRVLAAMADVLAEGKAPSRDLSKAITGILDAFEADKDPTKESRTPEQQKDLEKLNSVLTDTGPYTKSEVDYPAGKSLKIVPLQFPITFMPAVPQMGGVYFNPHLDVGTPAKTPGVSWEEDGEVQMPLVYIELGRGALYRKVAGKQGPPHTDDYIKSVLFHEFQHYLQAFAKRSEHPDLNGSFMTDKPDNSEVAAYSKQIAREAGNTQISDGELSGMLQMMAGYMKTASNKDDAIETIVAAVKSDDAARNRLEQLITALDIPELETLKKRLAASAPQPANPQPTKNKKGKKGGAGK